MSVPGPWEPTAEPPREHPWQAFLVKVQKPARYVGGELGLVRKPWSSVQVRICLAFPDVYEVGMSHLGYRILYDLLNRDARTLAERCYCPWSDVETELRERELPLISLESYRPLSDFDVVGFSLQFELTYTNVLTMLDLGGIPLRSVERGPDVPLVIAGGPTALHPEPVADFIDAFVIGDGEAKLSEVALEWSRLSREGVPRAARLARLARLGSVYVPSLYQTIPVSDHGLQVVERPPQQGVPFPVERGVVDLDDYPFPAHGPTGGPEAIFERLSVELARGCLEGCRFCQAGMTYRPLRERDPAALVDTALEALQHTGDAEISLTALSPADVSTLRPLMTRLGRALARQGVSLGVSSLRAYGLDPELLDELRHLRAAGLTFAPEAGSQRLRDVINKNVTEEQLRETAERVFSRGWSRMKLYFMIGLPTESDDDIQGIVETSARTAQQGRQSARRRVGLTVSVSTHVPKPHTPFQWEPMIPLDEIERRQGLLRQQVRAHRALKLRTHDARASVLEAVLARGDRRLGAVIETAWRAGARFDSWSEMLELELWDRALREHGLEHETFLGALPVGSRLPWDHVDVGVEASFLERERRRAHRAQSTPPCGKPAPRSDRSEPEPETPRATPPVCYQCGIDCDLDQLAARRWDDPSPSAEPAAATPEPSAPDPLPPHRREPAPTGQRVRVSYEKVGPAALLSHLDLVRELPRIFRRLGLAMVYTVGFHPKPIMTFGPALALGVPSLDERADIHLVEPLDPLALEALCQQMTAASPEGINLRSAEGLPPTEAGITKRIVAARYWLAVGPPKPASELARRCQELLALESIPMERETKRGRRTIDLRSYLIRLDVLEPAISLEAVRHRLRWPEDLTVVQADVGLSPAGSARPAELVAAVLGASPGPHRLARVALLSQDDLEPAAAPPPCATGATSI